MGDLEDDLDDHVTNRDAYYSLHNTGMTDRWSDGVPVAKCCTIPDLEERPQVIEKEKIFVEYAH